MTRRMAAREHARARGGRIVGLKTLVREKPAAIARPREWNFNVPPVSHFLALYRARTVCTSGPYRSFFLFLFFFALRATRSI